MRRLLLILLLMPTAHAGTWVPVGQGDCPGVQVVGSSGVEPERERCAAGFIGKTALCYTKVCNPGCEYIDVLTRDCRGGTEMADVYTCVADAPAARADPDASRDRGMEAPGAPPGNR